MSSAAPPAVAELLALRPALEDARLRVVIGVPGDDVHVVANQMTEALLGAVGYEVTNLGVLAPLTAFVDAAIAVEPAAILLSSVNGHALTNCGALPSMLRTRGIDVPTFLGGTLSVGKEDWALVERRFAALGFARVFPPHADLVAGVAAISATLLQRAGDLPAPLPAGRGGVHAA